MEIGRKLRTLRAEKNYTQEKMADLLKIPQVTYSNLENNKGKLDLNVIERIATIFGIDVIDILKDDGLIFNQKNKTGSNNGLVINHLSEKLIEQYELRITEKDNIIKELKQQIEILKRQAI